MPNANPSGVNQPLNQHPLPGLDRYTLGKDVNLFLAIPQGGVDTLIVPPPNTGGVREIGPFSSRCLLAFLQAAAADPATIALIYKDGNGNEIALNSTGLGAPDSVNPFDPDDGVLFLTPDDLGLFARVTEDSTGVVSVMASHSDVRNVTRKDVALTTSYQQVTDDVLEGNARFLTTALGEETVGASYIFNYDSALATVTLRFTIGGNVIEHLPSFPAIGVGSVFVPPLLCQALAPGDKIEAKVAVAPTTTAPIISIATSLTNQSPVRQDQGGAY